MSLGGAAYTMASGAFEANAASCEPGLPWMRSAVPRLRAPAASEIKVEIVATATEPASAGLDAARQLLRCALWVFGPDRLSLAGDMLGAAQAQGLTVLQDGAEVVVRLDLAAQAQPSEVLATALGVTTKTTGADAPSHRLAAFLGLASASSSLQEAMRRATFSLRRSTHMTAVRTEDGDDLVLLLDVESNAASLALRTTDLQLRQAIRLATALRVAGLQPSTEEAPQEMLGVHAGAASMMLDVNS